MRRVIFLFFIFYFLFFIFSPNEQRAGGGRGGRCQIFSFSFFPCSADHERDWPPCKVVFFGLATNALNVRNNNNNNTGFLIHLLSAVRALFFLARRIPPFLSLVDREVEFCVLLLLLSSH